jgi:hypothetical protein
MAKLKKSDQQQLWAEGQPRCWLSETVKLGVALQRTEQPGRGRGLLRWGAGEASSRAQSARARRGHVLARRSERGTASVSVDQPFRRFGTSA